MRDSCARHHSSSLDSNYRHTDFRDTLATVRGIEALESIVRTFNTTLREVVDGIERARRDGPCDCDLLTLALLNGSRPRCGAVRGTARPGADAVLAGAGVPARLCKGRVCGSRHVPSSLRHRRSLENCSAKHTTEEPADVEAKRAKGKIGDERGFALKCAVEAERLVSQEQQQKRKTLKGRRFEQCEGCHNPRSEKLATPAMTVVTNRAQVRASPLQELLPRACHAADARLRRAQMPFQDAPGGGECAEPQSADPI